MPAPWYHWQDGKLILDIRVQPRASHDEIAGTLDGRLKIRLTAPPVDGKANQTLLKFLAKLCAVSKSQVTLLSGPGSRNKRVAISAPKKLPAGVEPPEM
ncbi:MAG TPA: YggU family protein [Gammaproteobacteria bacterium]|nr:YggU family protein [Gammaproteobacteria bacterium]